MNKTKSRLQTAQPKHRRPRQADDALVYLKLRQNHCDHKKALIFTSRKEHKVFYRTDATIVKDGPASCRALTPSISKECIHSGWMINSKLKYKDAICPSYEISMNQTKQRKGVAKMIQDERTKAQSSRKQYKQYLGSMDFVLGQRHLNLQKIKESIRRNKRQKSQTIKCKGIKILQLSSIVSKQQQMKKSNSLISRLDAFKSVDSFRSSPSPKRQSFSRNQISRTPKHHISISTQQPIIPTPRLRPKTQLINYGTSNPQDNEFFFTLEQTIKKLPQLQHKL